MYRIGVDLGGMTIKAGIVNEKGEILISNSIPTDSERGSDSVLERMSDLCFHLVEKFNIKMEDIVSIGVGTPGTVNSNEGIVIVNFNLGFNNVELTKFISEKTGRPCFVENDANCAGLAEYYVGNAKGYSNLLTITIGTGIGGAYITDGKCLSGSFFGGGELGHMVVAVNGRPCTCGRKGCFEAYSSARELTTEMKRVGKENMSSTLVKMVDGDIEKLNPRVLFDALEKDCPVAKGIFDEYLLYFAEALGNFITIFEPEIILIGGGLSKQGEKLLGKLRPLVYERCFGQKSVVKIETTKFFNDAGIIGAAFIGGISK